MRTAQLSWLLPGFFAAACLIPGVEIDSSRGDAGGSGGSAGSSEAAAGGKAAGGAAIGGKATGGKATAGAATAGAATAGVAPQAGSAGEDGAAGAGVVCDAPTSLQLSEAPGRSTAPSVVWTGDGYGVAWQDNRDGNDEIYFARLDSEGNKLGDDVRVTQDAAASAAPVLVWSSSEFGLVWADGRDGNTEIYFARLGPTGTKLGGEVRVTTDAARSEFPSLVGAAGGGYAVAWNDTRDSTFQIYAARLDGSGAKLVKEKRVSGTTPLAASPTLAAAGDGFGVTWIDTRDAAGLQSYFARLDSSGARLGAELRLSELDLGGGGPSVASNGTGYAIAWGIPGNGAEIYWVSVGAEGSVEGSPRTLTASQNTAAFPVLISSGDGYAVAWPDGRDGDREIYVQELDASGGKLAKEVRVSDDNTASLSPSLTRSSVGYGVAWIDDPTETTGEVRFAKVCR